MPDSTPTERRQYWAARLRACSTEQDYTLLASELLEELLQAYRALRASQEA